MQIESAAYNVDGSVLAVIDGRSFTVPNNINNPDRRAIAEWEAAGGVIAPYVAPVEIPAVVTARQGKTQLLRMGLMTPAEAMAGGVPAFIAAIIAGMDPAAGAEIAMAWYESAAWHRDDPLFSGALMAAAAAATGQPATDETVDAFFVAAAAIA